MQQVLATKWADILPLRLLRLLWRSEAKFGAGRRAAGVSPWTALGGMGIARLINLFAILRVKIAPNAGDIHGDIHIRTMAGFQQ